MELILCRAPGTFRAIPPDLDPARRADWGLTWNKALETGGWAVGDEIGIVLDLEAAEAASALGPA